MPTEQAFIPKKYSKDQCKTEYSLLETAEECKTTYGLLETCTLAADQTAEDHSGGTASVSKSASFITQATGTEVEYADIVLSDCPAGFLVLDLVALAATDGAVPTPKVRVKVNAVEKEYAATWVLTGVGGQLYIHRYHLCEAIAAGEVHAEASIHNESMQFFRFNSLTMFVTTLEAVGA